ncbi:signal peptidase I [Sphingomicrobium astaxanthinifaciens]|nr:signal peptidase I [Sphingomicrobium astaxanthinifaciens]MCJ7421010.1 signal peptidase I [Sphingomicrobium astaxanthinifaciens]
MREVGAFLWRELKGLFWVMLAVLGFHSFIAKPFYIPSESMMPVLLEGDRLVVSKFPYGYSHVSPTIPNPAALARMLILRGPAEPWSITLPALEGRLFGSYPERGDIVIVTPPGRSDDYIKRVIGLPGDSVALTGGRLVLNGKAVPAERQPAALIPVDPNAPCHVMDGTRVKGADGGLYCRLPIVRETLPNGVSYDTVDLGYRRSGDEYGPITVPPGHVFLLGDNRDSSADSRVPLGQGGLGGPVRVERIGGRAEFITFSLDGTTSLNPASWWGSLREGRSWSSLRGSTARGVREE